MNARLYLLPALVVSVLGLELALPGQAVSQALPGAARGSQTGDGGSAYTGLASSPDANLFTGVAQASIPIEVPPGRLGLAPVLALSYSSSNGPGPVGYGWGLPLPRVHRSTRRGVPRYDETDEFVLEMPGSSSELERIPGSPRGFRARVESAFLRIGFHDGDNAWKVVDKLGVTFSFGTTAASRTGRGPSTAQTFAWLLERIEDPAGNRIDFEYAPGGAGGTSSGLPSAIRYGANARAAAPHFANVTFVWQPLTRAAPVPVSWRSGYAERLDRRLAAIETFTHGLPARRYDFSHEEDATTGDLRLVGATLTARAARAEDDVTLPSTVFVYAPATAPGWPATGSTSPLPAPFEVPDAGPLRIGERTVTADSLDLDGDAILDRIDTVARPPRVALGNGRTFGAWRPWNWPTTTEAPRCVRRSDSDGNLFSNVFDLDGDGFADLVDSNPAACAAAAGRWCVWRGTADGFSGAATAWLSPGTLLRRTEDGGAKIVTDLVDMDADGRPDFLDASPFDETAGTRWWHVYRNVGTGFEATPRRFTAPVEWLARNDGARLAFGLFDLNADSLPDLVSADPDYGGGEVRWEGLPSWTVHLNQGEGFSVEATDWPVAPGPGPTLPNFVNLHASDGSTIADLFDLTGDGRPDLVRRWRLRDILGPEAVDRCDPSSRCPIPDPDDPAVSPGSCCYNLVVYANTGSSFAAPVAWSSPTHGLRSDHDSCPAGYSSFTCYGSLTFDFDFFDFDGDGLIDFVERATTTARPYSWIVHPHPASGSGGTGRPNLLLAMRNGVGGETMLRYTTAAASKDSRMPFPHWVLRERELRDSVFDSAPLRTSFAYRGGWFDPAEREMRGFATVQEVDPVGITRVREYHQDRRRAGRLRRMTSLAPPPCVAASPDDPLDPCSPWNFPLGFSDYEWPAEGPVLLAAETDVPMHDGVTIENLRVTTRYAYDAWGNIARRRSETALAAATTTVTDYAYRVADRPGGMPDRYLVAKPTRVRTTEDGRPHPLIERSFEYETATATPGALAVASTCVQHDEDGCRRWSRRSFGYDPFGNLVVAHGPDGATSHTEYDGNALFAVRSIDPVGLVTTAVTDPRTGRVTETVAPNGNHLHSRHDGLGRLLRSWAEGSSDEHPRLRVDYAPGGLGDAPPRASTHDASGGRSTVFFDGLGRRLATKTQSETAGRPVSVLSGLQRRDSRGLVVAEALPFDSDDLDTGVLRESFADAPAWIEYQHDDAGHLVATTAPDGSVRRVDSSAPGILIREDANLAEGTKPGSVTIETFDGWSRRIQRDVCSARPTASSPYECPPGAQVRGESWSYDGLGRPEEVRTSGLGVAAGDAVARIARDGLGNRTEVRGSNSGTWSYRSDDSGRLVEVTKPDGARIVTTYDAAGRILRRRGPVTRAAYRYHSSGGGAGKLKRVSTRTRNARSTEDFAYDDRGRVSGRRRRVAPRGVVPAEISVAYEYDDLDRRVATVFPGWDAVHVDYDDFGREVVLWTDASPFVAAASFDSTGRRVRVDCANGVSDLLGYDERSNAARTAGHLRCLRTTVGAAADAGACDWSPLDLEARSYTRYDADGNLLAIDDQRYGAGDPRREDQRFSYDALGRLASAGSRTAVREEFAFDPLGNLTRNGEFTLSYQDPANPGQITSIRGADDRRQAVVHDANGRRTADDERGYSWDDGDRLAAVSLGGEPSREYGYMDTGERVFTHDVATGRWQFDLGDGVRLDGAVLERSLVFGGVVVAVERRALDAPDPAAPVTRVFLHRDHQQSVRVVTDQAGHAIEFGRYRAFGGRSSRLDGDGRKIDRPSTRFAYTGHVEDEDAGLLSFGARDYDPRTGSFLSLDPQSQFASPYAYSGGNPMAGRDADGSIFQLTAIELLTIAVGTAAFVDSIVRTGDLGHSLTAGVFAGFSVYFSGQLSTAMARPLAQVGHPWLQMAASVATDGFQALEAVEAIEDGRYAGGVVAAGMLAASLIGIESASDPGPGATPEENYARHGIKDRGVIDGQRTIDVNGICSTRPGCLSNILVAARENLRVLFGGQAACVGGCDHVAALTRKRLDEGEDVRLRCNSFGAIKCLGAVGDGSFAANMAARPSSRIPNLSVEMSGAPLLRPPLKQGITYQVNLFDPVVWVGTGWSTPVRSDVMLGRNWWVPAPVIVHHSRMYEVPFHEALGEMLP